MAMGPAATRMVFRLGTPLTRRGAASTDGGVGFCKLTRPDFPLIPRHRGSWVRRVLDRGSQEMAGRGPGSIRAGIPFHPPSPAADHVQDTLCAGHKTCRHVIHTHLHNHTNNLSAHHTILRL